jgi:hypothetical protein
MRSLDPDKVNYDLALSALSWILDQPGGGAVLVFMPGLMEITKMHEACLANPRVRHLGSRSGMNARSVSTYEWHIMTSLSKAERRGENRRTLIHTNPAAKLRSTAPRSHMICLLRLSASSGHEGQAVHHRAALHTRL